MKKFTILLAAVFGLNILASAQPISDRAVIPVAVTLNQVLRLNITSGGNMEFVFSTIDHYKTGIANTNRYSTFLNVSSSNEWVLNMYSETSSLVGLDLRGTMSLNNIGYSIQNVGAYQFDSRYTAFGSANLSVAGLQSAANISTIACRGGGISSSCAGDGSDNRFVIRWRVGTGESNNTVAGAAMNGTSFINQNYQADRYTANVLLDLLTSGL
jgi:hypothetical protein